MKRAYKLREIDAILEVYSSKEKVNDINHILDLYAIFELLKEGNKLTIWDEDAINEYHAISKDFPKVVGVFVSQIENYNLLEIYNKVSNLNRFDFWKLFNDFKMYEKISSDTFSELLKLDVSLYYILAYKKIVEKYDECLSDYIISNEDSIEIILNKILSYDGNTSDIIIPKSLTPKTIVDLADKYIDSSRPNPNFLELIASSRSSNDFPITDEIRLKAKTAYHQYWKKAKKDMTLFKNGIEVSFKPNLNVEKYEEYENHTLKYEYSSNWVSENLDFPTLLNNFIYLLDFTDNHFRSSFVYKSNESGIFEDFFNKRGKTDYPKNYMFNIKNSAFSLKLTGYIYELKKHDMTLEKLFEWYFKTYLKEEFGVEGFLYLAPSANATILEKCILLSCAIDAVLKQFNMFRKYGQINRELFEMSSGHVIFGNIKSLSENKYLYTESVDLKKEQHLLFSDQSLLNYTEKTKEKYETLPQLLRFENLTKSDFYEYQLQDIEWLLSRKSIIYDEEGFLKPNNEKIVLLKDLYDNEVSCYQYNKRRETIIMELLNNKDLKVENSLFTIPEQQYLNYVLNRAEFGNGLDLRNKYVHGTYSLNLNRQESDYIELLKVMILIIIKINEEFCLKFPLK